MFVLDGSNLFMVWQPRLRSPRGLIKAERWLGLNQNSAGVHFGKSVLEIWSQPRSNKINPTYSYCFPLSRGDKHDNKCSG